MNFTSSAGGFNARRLRSNLLRHEAALGRLAMLGIDRALVEAAGLGMKEPYMTVDGVHVAGVVTYPLHANGERCRYGYMTIEGVTQNAHHSVAWSPGEPGTVRHGEGPVLLVLPSPLAVLQARASIDRRGLGVCVLASSQPERMPAGWAAPALWAPWDRVIVSEALPSAIRRRLAVIAGRPLELAAPPTSGSTVSFAGVEEVDGWVDGMLAAGTPYQNGLEPEDRTGDQSGDFAAIPISLHGGIAASRMYFPFAVERRRPDSKSGAMLCSYETVVLRSDGAVLEARTLPAPAGTPTHKRVHTLTDGTRIIAPPEASRNSTWSLSAVQRFVELRSQGEDPCKRGAGDVFFDVRSAIAEKVRLPEEDDYWIAAAFVVMTYMFRIFPAIPLLTIEGQKGTGKTELAASLASLSFNAVTMGQGSAAALVRVARECGGLVVLDDVEGLSAGGQGFGELSQCLKVGYRASTATKPIVLPSGRVENFDFFGPRLLTSTRGVEPVLASRCIRITTGKDDSYRAPANALDSADLRDELHALGMSRAFEVAACHVGLASHQDRFGEIWSPLLAIADTLGPMEAAASLRRALEIRR